MPSFAAPNDSHATRLYGDETFRQISKTVLAVVALHFAMREAGDGEPGAGERVLIAEIQRLGDMGLIPMEQAQRAVRALRRLPHASPARASFGETLTSRKDPVQ